MPDRVRHDIPLVAGRLNKAARAFVKVQDGCDNACSYCVVPRARGPHRSVPAEHAIAEIRSLVEAGYQEVVLTGVNISAYGRDGTSESGAAARGQGLARLLRRILDETDLPRLRLSSLQPEDWHPDLFALWDSGRLCRHLHLSLQSGSNSVLRRMRRRYDVERYAAIVEEARRQVPGVAITTDVIVGFPGETDQEFAETERFIRAVGFAGLHVFKYSPREGTVAATMEGQVHSRVKQERSARLIALGGAMASDFASGFAGSVLSVLWEEPLTRSEVHRLLADGRNGSTWWSGLSDNYLRVYACGERILAGAIAGARVERTAGEGVLGVLAR